MSVCSRIDIVLSLETLSLLSDVKSGKNQEFVDELFQASLPATDATEKMNNLASKGDDFAIAVLGDFVGRRILSSVS